MMERTLDVAALQRRLKRTVPHGNYQSLVNELRWVKSSQTPDDIIARLETELREGLSWNSAVRLTAELVGLGGVELRRNLLGHLMDRKEHIIEETAAGNTRGEWKTHTGKQYSRREIEENLALARMQERFMQEARIWHLPRTTPLKYNGQPVRNDPAQWWTGPPPDIERWIELGRPSVGCPLTNGWYETYASLYQLDAERPGEEILLRGLGEYLQGIVMERNRQERRAA